MRFALKLLTGLLAWSVSGCATPPDTYVFANKRAYEQSFDVTWEKLVLFFTSNNIPLKTIEKDSGVLYAERLNLSSVDSGAYMDCGNPGINQVVNGSISVNVFARRLGDESTEVTVNTVYSQTREFDGRRHVVDCNSNGVLENEILSVI